MSMSTGFCSGNIGAKIASTNTITIQEIANQNRRPSLRLRATCCSTSSGSESSSVAMANPGIEDRIEHVDDEVHDHEAGGNQQHHTLEDDEIAGIDRADQ